MFISQEPPLPLKQGNSQRKTPASGVVAHHEKFKGSNGKVSACNKVNI